LAAQKKFRHQRVSKVRTNPFNLNKISGQSMPLLIPYISLQGRWLESAGFIPGQLVLVDVKKHRLIITPLSADV
jgi:hypothetical protein